MKLPLGEITNLVFVVRKQSLPSSFRVPSCSDKERGVKLSSLFLNEERFLEMRKEEDMLPKGCRAAVRKPAESYSKLSL